MIYAIQAGECGPIKLGISGNPWSRLDTLQTGCPQRLSLRAVVDWNDCYERHLHCWLADDRLYGEWFSPNERVRLVVEAMKSGSEAAFNIIQSLATGVDVAKFSRETGITKDTPWSVAAFREFMDAENPALGNSLLRTKARL